MTDHIQKFIDSMSEAGLAPADVSQIKPEDKLLSYRLVTDKGAQKKGFYRLSIDLHGDFAYGYFGDWRIGDSHNWHSKTERKMTREERIALDKRMELARERSEQEQKERYESCAREAKDFLLFLDNAIEHTYLHHKQIKPCGALISGNDLIIPMRDSAQVWSYQSIQPNGTKMFFGGKSGARAGGLWFKIPGDSVICVCEGYATGASIHEATGHTVYVTFNAGNMVSCAREIRAMHPDAKIIFCADNDWYKTDKNGTIIQTGIKRATKAATEIDGYIGYPDTADLQKGSECTDFNDLFLLCGPENVRDRINNKSRKPNEIQASVMNAEPVEAIAGGVIPPTPTPLPDSDWRSFLQLKKDGSLQERSTTNLLLIMRNDERLSGVFKYDSFSKTIIVAKCPPWENEQSFKVRQLKDYDYIRLEAFLETVSGLKTGREKCADAIVSTAQLPCNTFNPATDYFESLQWDGVKRLDTWLKRYVSNGSQSDEYLRTVGRKFLCGLAARAMSPGVKFDTMIILEGKQNGGKSRLANTIATINGTEYFLDDFRDIDNKDSLMKIQGKLVVEFPEITTMRRTEVNELKGFLSRQTDSFRAPYARNTIESPRQCVFVGTVNPEGEYFRDVTGNRRYWPVSCSNKINLDAIKQIMPQMHAEAAFLVKNGEQLWLNDEEYYLAEFEQGKRVQSDVWSERIEDVISGKDWVSTTELLEFLQIPLERRNSNDNLRVSKIMTSLGWESSRRREGRIQKRGWSKCKTMDTETEDILI